MSQRTTRSNAFGTSDTATTPNAAVSVGTEDKEIVAANPARVEITICNDHATNVVYLSLGGTAVVNRGIRLNPAGGSYTTNAYTGEIRGIATGAATPATVSEV